MIDYRTPPLGYLVRVPQESLDSSLDESARARAEDAARFLSFERIGMVVASHRVAAIETADIILSGDAADQDIQDLDSGEVIEAYLSITLPTRPMSYVFIAGQQAIAAAISKLTGANVCGEIVAPGGIISIHRSPVPSGSEGTLSQFRVIARHMILDFSFTDFVQSVAETDQTLSQQGSLAPLRD